MIYFMQAVEGGPIKIGHSVDVGRRHEELELHYKRLLVILAVIEGDLNAEGEMHSRFSHLRLPSRSGRGRKPELFRPEADLMDFIRCHLLVDQNPDVVEAMMSKDDSKTFRFFLPLEAHKELRVEAAKEGMSMASFVRHLVEEFLTKVKGGKPPTKSKGGKS